MARVEKIDTAPDTTPGNAAPDIVVTVLLGVATLGGLYAVQQRNYLLFHCLSEGFAIVIACGVFMLAWSARRRIDNEYLLLLGIAYLFVGFVDLMHTLAYKGMGVFPGYGANLATELWIGARYLEALTLTAAPIALKVRLRSSLVLMFYTALTGLFLVSVFGGFFPDCFVEGEGLTLFKVVSEYIISLILVLAAVLLYRRRAAFEPIVLRLLIASILITVASEMSFTLYTNPYGFFNMLGHFLKLVSFYLIYKAVIVTGLARPYDLLYRRLRDSEERYRALFETMSEGFALHEIITDSDNHPVDYRFLEINPSFEILTGLKRNDLIGRRVLEVLPATEDYWIDAFGRVALTGEPAHLENFSVALNSWFDVIAYRSAPRRFAVIITNITERKRAEKQLQELNASLEQRVDERTSEIRQQADKLRALANQLGWAEQRERKRLAKILHDHLQQLLVAARMQLALGMECVETPADMEPLLAAGKAVDVILEEAIQASRSLTIDLSPPALQEGGLIGGLNWLASRLRQKNQFTVNLRTEIQAEPGEEETRFLLFECVRELLFNAVKHAGVPDAEVTLMRVNDSEIQLIIADRGKGFDPDLQKTKKAGEATFGLFSVQERLRCIGGRMEIETAPGRGTTITLRIPSAIMPEAEAPADAPPAAEPIGMRRKRDVFRVLIADDHRIMREGLKGLLQFQSDIEVVGEAADGAQAVKMAEQLQPDVVIMDVNLGEGLKGLGATRQILAASSQIKVIGLSMHSDVAIANAMRDAGVYVYLTKGGPVEDLIAAIRACRGE